MAESIGNNGQESPTKPFRGPGDRGILDDDVVPANSTSFPASSTAVPVNLNFQHEDLQFKYAELQIEVAELREETQDQAAALRIHERDRNADQQHIQALETRLQRLWDLHTQAQEFLSTPRKIIEDGRIEADGSVKFPNDPPRSVLHSLFHNEGRANSCVPLTEEPQGPGANVRRKQSRSSPIKECAARSSTPSSTRMGSVTHDAQLISPTLGVESSTKPSSVDLAIPDREPNEGPLSGQERRARKRPKISSESSRKQRRYGTIRNYAGNPKQLKPPALDDNQDPSILDFQLKGEPGGESLWVLKEEPPKPILREVNLLIGLVRRDSEYLDQPPSKTPLARKCLHCAITQQLDDICVWSHDHRHSACANCVQIGKLCILYVAPFSIWVLSLPASLRAPDSPSREHLGYFLNPNLTAAEIEQGFKPLKRARN